VLLSSLVGKSVAVKAALALAGLSAAGVGVAAETGSLPTPVQQAAHRVAGGLGVPAATSAPVRTADASPEPSDSPEPGSSAQPSPSPSEGHGPDATGPAAKGLCTAYNSGRKAGRSTDSTAFQALAAAAGGTDGIDAYCAQVLASPTPDPSESDPSNPDPSDPASPDQQGTHADSAATGHGTGKSNSGSGKSSTTSHGGGADGNGNGHH
jgi:hypothetical protein